MKKKFWHFYLALLWKLQRKITNYSIHKWHDKDLVDKYGFITSCNDKD